MEIKNCPFCGVEGISISHEYGCDNLQYSIRCDNYHSTRWYPTEEEAIIDWNKRESENATEIALSKDEEIAELEAEIEHLKVELNR